MQINKIFKDGIGLGGIFHSAIQVLLLLYLLIYWCTIGKISLQWRRYWRVWSWMRPCFRSLEVCCSELLASLCCFDNPLFSSVYFSYYSSFVECCDFDWFSYGIVGVEFICLKYLKVVKRFFGNKSLEISSKIEIKYLRLLSSPQRNEFLPFPHFSLIWPCWVHEKCRAKRFRRGPKGSLYFYLFKKREVYKPVVT